MENSSLKLPQILNAESSTNPSLGGRPHEKSGGKPAFLTLSCFDLKGFFWLERLSRF
jgi:hypothetical protein